LHITVYGYTSSLLSNDNAGKNKSYEKTNSEFVEFVSIPQKLHPSKNPHRLPTEPMGIHHSPHTHTHGNPHGNPHTHGSPEGKANYRQNIIYGVRNMVAGQQGRDNSWMRKASSGTLSLFSTAVRSIKLLYVQKATRRSPAGVRR